MTEDTDQILAKQFAQRKQLRDICQSRITALFQEVGEHYLRSNVATLDLHQIHDVHAFYRLIQDPTRVVHVQGYPGMSSGHEARVWARMMDYRAMMLIRHSGIVSIGNEHKATILGFRNFAHGIMIPYVANALEAKLAENVPELTI
ncbi:hypothetical protein J4208_04110 [Candidatus Woesearchaeota archaeon]|nr:hypothetical protein [Candidatus Woesearchaeota archaeon]